MGSSAQSEQESIAAALFPLFLKLSGREVLVVGGGPVATAKVGALLETGAKILVVAPELRPELEALAKSGKISIERRCFQASDLGSVWLVVAAGPCPRSIAWWRRRRSPSVSTCSRSTIHRPRARTARGCYGAAA